MMQTATAKRSKKISMALWILQGLLALFFAAGSGAPKLIVTADMLPMPIPLPAALILFIETCEVLGALGLILPGLTGVRPGLTPLAAAAWPRAASGTGPVRGGGAGGTTPCG